MVIEPLAMPAISHKVTARSCSSRESAAVLPGELAVGVKPDRLPAGATLQPPRYSRIPIPLPAWDRRARHRNRRQE
jgi:hypothetical protein